MDYLYLVVVGAIGWTGFIGCLWAMKTRYRLNLQFIEETHEIEVKMRPSTDLNDPVRGVPVKGIIDHSGKWQSVTQPQTIIEPEIPEEMHRIAQIVEPLIDQYDTVRQSGDWKRHQVYAAVLKNQKVLDIIGDDKWKAGFAIELAVAQRRMNAEEVGA